MVMITNESAPFSDDDENEDVSRTDSAREREPDLPRKDQKGGRGNTGNVWQRVATCGQRVATCGNVFLSAQITRNQRESTTFNDFQRESTRIKENQRKSDQNGVAPKLEPPKEHSVVSGHERTKSDTKNKGRSKKTAQGGNKNKKTTATDYPIAY
jgi:hypothetical protein